MSLYKNLILPSVLVLSTALAFGQCQLRQSKPTQIISTLEQQILRETARHQTVMFGERHSEGRNPSFDIVIPLLPELKKQGFDYFAVELPRTGQYLVDDAASGRLRKEEYLFEFKRALKATLLSEGFYPIICAAKQNGLNVIAYDDFFLNPIFSDEREQISFDNLDQLIFRKNPSAKVLVYCGAAHISEISYPQLVLSSVENQGRLIINDTSRTFTPLGQLLNDFTKNKNLGIDLSGGSADYPDVRIVNGKYLRVK